MKTWMILILGFCIISPQKLISQPDTLIDLLPLGIRHSWVYLYYNSWSQLNNFGEGDTYVDSGDVTYTIVDSTSNVDSVYWNIRTNWNRILHYYKNYPPIFDTTYAEVDSGNFVLLENTFGKHQLIVDSTVSSQNPIWRFYPSEIESSRIYRYPSIDSADNYSVSTDSYVFTFKPDSGLIAMSYYIHGTCGLCAASAHARIVSGVLTTVDELVSASPQRAQSHLFQNYPNPFNPTTTITFSLSQDEFVTLKIFNILGQEVANVLGKPLLRGRYNIRWDGSSLPGGIYFYRLQAGIFTDTKKLLLIK